MRCKTLQGSLIQKSHVRRLKEKEIEEELRRFDAMDKLVISILELGETLLTKDNKNAEWQKMEMARACLRMFRDAQTGFTPLSITSPSCGSALFRLGLTLQLIVLDPFSFL